MSKGRVWNQGKRNGGPPKGSKGKPLTRTNEGIPTVQPIEAIVAEINREIDIPINSVKRMNRDNWVQRPVREIRKEAKAMNNDPGEEGSSSL
ncbi:hypothetical protein [Paenibacillus sp. IHBB 10380]|uniref:hypothetical protein n=1 Tax=Paenibacillus sp. IHBB 10380 TaxID=1566358 RepID=UPI0005CFB5AE|nr:hypothetical protein [Paenibacillus sp. IHBB 10380]AJS58427.1 hypothetical protein UB51_07855 [Paenibacillus sp. IHBB 10380]